ncbi:UNVERIFIED_CONTAM: hypothetical protein PYX00_002041 [Menopon gallinae]|uniref:HTH CENPB-type domain-containing protein n=1 Tax=Menopon gallinae TaxID=328185 RepID=A0AAW2IFS8_9NEOP
MKRKKSCSESGSEDGRERKCKKVMPKSLAVEIDAEADADGAVGLQNSSPKSALAKSNIREIDLERALYRWYERYQQQRREVSRSDAALTAEELARKAKNLVQRLGGSAGLSGQISTGWIARWQERYGVPKSDVPDSSVKQESEPKTYLEPIKQRLKKKRFRKNEENEVSSSLDEKEEPEDPRKMLTIDTGGDADAFPERSEAAQTLLKLGEDVRPVFEEYDSDKVYFAFCFELDWKSLPDKTLESKNDEPVWLLMAGNRSGRHRTRILVTGRHWRPGCLKHVNMLSQPVVYAGGGKGMMTPDLFAWWFSREFVPAAESLHSEAVLILEERWSSAKLQGGHNVKLVTVRDDEIIDWGMILAEFRTRYATLLLRKLSWTEMTSITQYLSEFTLKEAFPLFHKSWLIIRPETFQRFSDPRGEGNEERPHSSESISVSLIQSAMMGGGKEEQKEKSGRKKPEMLSLSRRGTATQEDRMLLLELQWATHDVGLEVTDEDLSCWAANSSVVKMESVKTEESDPCAEGRNVPNAAEAAEHLSRALLWLETQPIDPNLLLIVRDVIDVAKQASKMGLAPPHPGAALPFFCHNGDHLTQPPPAHMGIPPYQLDAKGAGAMGLSRSPMYPFPAGSTYPYPMLSPEMSQVAASWHTPGMYPISAGAGFRSPYPTSLPISTTLPSDFYRFSPTGLLPGHPGLSPHGHHSLSSHPAIVTPGPKQELGHHTQSDHNHR